MISRGEVRPNLMGMKNKFFKHLSSSCPITYFLPHLTWLVYKPLRLLSKAFRKLLSRYQMLHQWLRPQPQQFSWLRFSGCSDRNQWKLRRTRVNFRSKHLHGDYNNCHNSRALIGSWLWSVRRQNDHDMKKTGPSTKTSYKQKNLTFCHAISPISY